MSRYGPPGGAHGAHSGPPGEPDQPRYGPPADPWGQRPDSWDEPTTAQPGGGYREPGHPTVPGYPGNPAGPGHPAGREPRYPGHPGTGGPPEHRPAGRPGPGGPPAPYPGSGYPGPAYPGPAPYPGPAYPGTQPPGGSGARWAGLSDGWPPDDPAGPDRRPAGTPHRRRLVAAMVAVLVVVMAVAVGSLLFMLAGEDAESVGAGDSGATATADPEQTGSAGDSGSGAPAPASGPPDNIGMNASMALVDDCLVNDGTEQDVRLRIVRCDDEQETGVVYRVLAVFNEKVTGDEDERLSRAQQICDGTEGYTHHYYEVGENVAPSFVLCMAEEE